MDKLSWYGNIASITSLFLAILSFPMIGWVFLKLRNRMTKKERKLYKKMKLSPAVMMVKNSSFFGLAFQTKENGGYTTDDEWSGLIWEHVLELLVRRGLVYRHGNNGQFYELTDLK